MVLVATGLRQGGPFMGAAFPASALTRLWTTTLAQTVSPDCSHHDLMTLATVLNPGQHQWHKAHRCADVPVT